MSEPSPRAREAPGAPPGALSGASSAAPHANDGDGRHRYATQNRLLGALPAEELAWLEPHLERVPLGIGDVLAEPGEPLRHVYFPETAIVSIVNRMADGSAVEVGTVGNEGMVGVAAFLDAEASESQTLCQVPGPALRVPAAVVTEAGDARRRSSSLNMPPQVQTPGRARP